MALMDWQEKFFFIVFLLFYFLLIGISYLVLLFFFGLHLLWLFAPHIYSTFNLFNLSDITHLQFLQLFYRMVLTSYFLFCLRDSLTTDNQYFI